MRKTSSFKWMWCVVVAMVLLVYQGKALGEAYGKIIIFDAGSLTISFRFCCN